MSSVAPARLQESANQGISGRALRTVLSVGLGCIAAYFVFRYASRFTEYSASAYRPYWDVRWSIIFHVLGGVMALALGPLQFSTRLRQRRPTIHRLFGRFYLGGVLVGSVAALHLILAHSKPAFGIPLLGLNIVWAASAAMALVAIRFRNIQQHREWMIRSYVATYAFVVFRFLLDVPALGALGPQRFITIAWLCWTLPLFCTEIMLQWRRVVAKQRV